MAESKADKEAREAAEKSAAEQAAADKAAEKAAKNAEKEDARDVTMYAPEDGGAVSYNGVSYTPNKDGAVRVPREAMAALREHGYSTDKPKKAS